MQKIGVDLDNTDFSDLKVPPRPHSVKMIMKQSNNPGAAQRSQTDLLVSSTSNALMKNTVMA